VGPFRRAAPESEPHEEGVFDPADVWRVLQADDETERGALLERLALVGEPEGRIASELLDRRPLLHSDRFEEAHRGVMHAVEVLDRNGPEPAALPRLGPLAGPVRLVVRLFTGWIVRSHRDRLVGTVRELYTMREAITVPASSEQRMLLRARRQASAVEETLRGNGFAVPTFLVGGVLLTTVFSAIRNLFGSVLGLKLGTLLVPLVLASLVAGLAWCALYAAGVAHRRIRLAADRPVAELWEAIGNCGSPPHDHSYGLAFGVIVMTLLAWIALPLLVWLVV